MLIYLRQRKVYGGFGHWILANFGLSVGYMFISLRDRIPGFLSIIVGNCLIAYCIILIYEGIERFYERPRFNAWNYLILGSYILIQSLFTYFDPDINARVTISSLVVCTLIVHTGTRLFRVPIGELKETSSSAGYVFFVTAIFPFTRAVSALLASQPIDFFSDAINSWFSVVFIVSIVTWTFYFFFLNSARLELELETARAKLDLIARTDPLTNLYNRRHFDEHAELELQRAKRSGHSISFLLLDVDGFKSINDNNGHEVGDAVLLSLSEILRSELRPFDMVARYGGDEFIIMLMDTTRDQAYSVAERICNRVGQTPVLLESRTLNFTLSGGLTTVQPGDHDLRLLLKRGDIALYNAKQRGRNCVIVA